MSFSDEKVIFTQYDMDESNFAVDKNGKMCILDVMGVSLLPESFASFSMNSSAWNDPFLENVAGYLQWPRSPNHKTMARVGGILGMMADTTLGTSLFIPCRTFTNNNDDRS